MSISILLLTCFNLVVFVTAALLFWRWRRASINGNIPLSSQAARIPSYQESLSVIRQELARARRYHRPLSLVSLALSSSKEVLKERETFVSPDADRWLQTVQVAYLLLGAIWRDALRTNDILAYDGASSEYLIILPETTKTQAAQCVERLQKLAAQRAFIELHAGFSEFPKDGFTLPELIDNARRTSVPQEAAPSEVQMASV